jgi:hypothetical protein
MQALYPIEHVTLASLPAASAYPNSIVVVGGLPFFSDGATWTDLTLGGGGGFDYGKHLAMSGLLTA